MSVVQVDTIVVGAGAAGLAAAAALTGAGQSVVVLERKPYVGGRAYSYKHPALGEVVDSQHVLLGCIDSQQVIQVRLLRRARAAWPERGIERHDSAA